MKGYMSVKFFKDPLNDVELEFCEDLNVILGKVRSEVCQVEKNKSRGREFSVATEC